MSVTLTVSPLPPSQPDQSALGIFQPDSKKIYIEISPKIPQTVAEYVTQHMRSQNPQNLLVYAKFRDGYYCLEKEIQRLQKKKDQVVQAGETDKLIQLFEQGYKDFKFIVTTEGKILAVPYHGKGIIRDSWYAPPAGELLTHQALSHFDDKPGAPLVNKAILAGGRFSITKINPEQNTIDAQISTLASGHFQPTTQHASDIAKLALREQLKITPSSLNAAPYNAVTRQLLSLISLITRWFHWDFTTLPKLKYHYNPHLKVFTGFSEHDLWPTLLSQFKVNPGWR